MSGATTELSLATAVDSDDNADYLTINLANSLRTVDGLFNNVTGHNHGSAHQGGPISTSSIQDGTVTLAKLAANSVDSSKIVDGSIALADLAPNSVDTSKIVDGTITAADLNPALGNFGAGTIWTPSTNQGGTGPTASAINASYVKIGRLVLVQAMITYSNLGQAGYDIIVSTTPIPPRWTGGYTCIGSFVYVRSAVGVYAGSVVSTAAALLKFAAGGSDGTNIVQPFLGNTGGPSFAIGIGDVLSFSLFYESAS
jgi:hypothetical protein